MPPDRRLLREIRSAYKGMKETQILSGQWAHWFRFSSGLTTSHPVYDTGPQRVWYSSIAIPVIEGIYSRAPQRFDDDGLYLVDRLSLIISKDAFYSSTLLDPDLTGQNHLNDRVGFDGRLFSVDSFIPRGRVASYFLTISVGLQQVTNEDLDEDISNQMFLPYVVAS